MHGFPSTNHNDQQSQPQGEPPYAGESSVDRATAEWFCQKVTACAEAAAKSAGVEDGHLVLSSYGQLPATGDTASWKEIPPEES